MEYSQKSWLATFLLAFFVGGLGIHRFYVGKIGTGILMLFTLGGLGIWTLIDWIIILCGGFKDSEGKVIKSDISSSSSTSKPEKSDEEKIREWHKLYTDGIITKAEYEAKRKTLIKG